MTTDPARQGMPALVVASLTALYAWLVFATTFRNPGAIGLNYIAPGSDWSVMHAAVRLAGEGRYALLNDGTAFTAYLNTAYRDWFPQPLAYRPWVYPPTYLIMLWPFGNLSLQHSYVAFQLLSAIAFALTLSSCVENTSRSHWIVVGALLCPAAANNVVCGQNAFLVAALLLFGIWHAPTKPVMAGLALGVLTFKPQFGLLIPVALVAHRQWRAIAAAGASALILAATSAAVFGTEPWIWFFNESRNVLGQPNSDWVVSGRLWGNSVYACAVLFGAPTNVASALQGATVLTLAVLVFLVCRSQRRHRLKCAFLLAATFLAAPHSGGYDLLLLATAGLLWLAELRRVGTSERVMILLLWIAPLVGPPALVPVGRLAPVVALAFLYMVWRTPVVEPMSAHEVLLSGAT